MHSPQEAGHAEKAGQRDPFAPDLRIDQARETQTSESRRRAPGRGQGQKREGRQGAQVSENSAEPPPPGKLSGRIGPPSPRYRVGHRPGPQFCEIASAANSIRGLAEFSPEPAESRSLPETGVTHFPDFSAGLQHFLQNSPRTGAVVPCEQNQPIHFQPVRP